MKSFQKAKSGKNQAGLGFRTPDFIKKSRFEGGKASQFSGATKTLKFNPAQFKTQHKG